MTYFEGEVRNQFHDWYFFMILLFLGIFTIMTYYELIPLDLGIASLLILLIILFFALEEMIPNARDVRKRKHELRKKI